PAVRVVAGDRPVAGRCPRLGTGRFPSPRPEQVLRDGGDDGAPVPIPGGAQGGDGELHGECRRPAQLSRRGTAGAPACACGVVGVRREAWSSVVGLVVGARVVCAWAWWSCGRGASVSVVCWCRVVVSWASWLWVSSASASAAWWA